MTETELGRFLEQCSQLRPDIKWMGTLQHGGDRLSLCGARDGLSRVVRSGRGTDRTADEAMALVADRLDRLSY